MADADVSATERSGEAAESLPHVREPAIHPESADGYVVYTPD